MSLKISNKIFMKKKNGGGVSLDLVRFWLYFYFKVRCLIHVFNNHVFNNQKYLFVFATEANRKHLKPQLLLHEGFFFYTVSSLARPHEC